MEKRKQKRIDLSQTGWHADLIDQMVGMSLGKLVNLSTSGLMIVTAQPVETDSLYQVECVSHGPNGQVTRFSAGVVVLWVKEASSRDTRWVGMQIIDIGTEERKSLLATKQALTDS